MNLPPYSVGLMDLFLEQIRASIPWAELRHDSLAPMARACQFLSPWTPPRRSGVHLSFADGSTPLTLRTPLVLAAGAAKHARHLDAFASFGFGAVTVGTATLRARKGNPLMPRVKTLEDDGAIQNAMGLNNPGIEVLARRIDASRQACDSEGLLVGISVAEDPDLLSGETADDNVLACLQAAWSAGDYFELNLSCPNTGHERLDRAWERVDRLLAKVSSFRERQSTRKPVWVKLSPDLSDETIAMALESIRTARLTGAVLFNTWPAGQGTWPDGSELPELCEVGRPGLKGGLSGRPLYSGTIRGLRAAKPHAKGLSLLASGGVETGAQVDALRDAGADLVEIYSVLAFRWMAARRIVDEMSEG